MSTKNAGIIINPVAGAGRGQICWKAIEQSAMAIADKVQLRITTGPAQAEGLALEICRAGAEFILVIGGDGTISEAASGILRHNAATGANVSLGIVPAGTGSDLARTLGLSADPVAALRAAMSGSGRRIDAGRVSFMADDGKPASRHFINIASLGLSGPTDRAVNEAKRSSKVAGRLVFMFHTIRELLRYRFQDVVVSVDGQPPVTARIAVVAIANGRFFGAGMMIAPNAQPDDAMLDVVIFRGANKLKLIAEMNKIYTGAHVALPGVTMLRGKKISVEPVGGLAVNKSLLDLDGESPGSIPATFEVLPLALTVRL